MRLLGFLAIALTGAAGSAWAIDLAQRNVEVANGVVDVSYQASVARLGEQGYRVVRLVPFPAGVRLARFDSYMLEAVDRVGHEVLLAISMMDGRIMRSDYLHDQKASR